MDLARKDVRSFVCYDWRNNTDLLIGNDGEWYLGHSNRSIGQHRQKFSYCPACGESGDLFNHATQKCACGWERNGWGNVKCVSEKLHTLNSNRVRCMQGCGQVDGHVRAKEMRDSFISALRELETEAYWEKQKRNFGNAERYEKLVKRFLPLISSVETPEWSKALEIMQEILATLEP